MWPIFALTKNTQHMKRIKMLAACAVALIISTNTQAQLGIAKKVVPKVTIGGKLGLNMQQTTVTDNVLKPTFDNGYNPGILGGLFVSVDKKKKGVRVEGLLKSAKLEGSGVAYSIRTLALDIPVLFEYRVVKRVWLQVGPQFTTLLSAKGLGAYKDEDYKGTFRNSDLSLVGGVEVHLPMKLTAGVRYVKGFIDVNNTVGTEKWRNSSIQVSVGYRLLN